MNLLTPWTIHLSILSENTHGVQTIDMSEVSFSWIVIQRVTKTCKRQDKSQSEIYISLISVHPLEAPVKQTHAPPSAGLGIFPFLRRLEAATAAAKANAAGALPAPAAMNGVSMAL